MLDKAINLASSSTMGVYDKFGKPYILNCLTIMNKLEEYGEDFMIVGVLSKPVEKKLITIEQLEKEKFDKSLIDVLKLFLTQEIDNEALEKLSENPETKRDYYNYLDTCYFTYLTNLSSNKISRKIKLIELEYLTRIGSISTHSEEEYHNLIKYHNGYDILKSYDMSDNEEILLKIKTKEIILTIIKPHDDDNEYDENIIKYFDEKGIEYSFNILNHEWSYT